MFDPISYLPIIIEGLLGTILGGIKGKVDNATAIELKKAEQRIEAELITLQHKYDLEKLKYAQRHELQMKLLSLLEKIDMVQLSSPAQIEAFKDLMQVALSLAADNYVEKIENMVPRLRNITPHVEPSKPAALPSSSNPFLLEPINFHPTLRNITPGALPNPSRLFEPINFGFPGATANVREVTFADDLGGGIKLEMVAIPGGTFLMGSPDNELERESNESPRHQVKIAPFYMGKFVVTQAQWRAVANLPQIITPLDLDPSGLKGANRPVENISWYETVEFLARLSQKTKKEYRLPSEAEWEYACRAGTTTPFHFGETITTDLANYRGTDHPFWGSGVYGFGSKGICRKETTPVGSFKVANAFGLYDMHGNVDEWCADPWHENYNGAPGDGRVWDEKDNDNRYQSYLSLGKKVKNDDRQRVLRGGSWSSNPRYCRSAFRLRGSPGGRSIYLGFRAVCSVE
jgi:formylglycine-generating enzyme required for sulfatase activity